VLKSSVFGKIRNAFSVLKGNIHIFGNDSWDKLLSFTGGILDEDSGQEVTSESGTALATVFSCLNNLSQDLATQPKQLKRNTSEGIESLSNQFTHMINHKPNKWENAWHFWYGIVFMGEGWGNSYAYISNRDSQGYASELVRIKPWLVTHEIVNNELYYVIDNKVAVHSLDMFHYRSMVTSSPIGENKISFNAKTIGLKLKQQSYTSKSVGNKPPGILFLKTATKEQALENKEEWNRQVAGDNLAGTPVLRGEVDYKNIMLDPKATEIIMQHNLTDQWIMSIWRISPSMLSKEDKTSYSQAEQQNINYVRYALMPITVNLEQEMGNKLLPISNVRKRYPEYLKLNLKSLLRGDIKTQTEYYKSMRTGGILNADEIRAFDDLPPQKDDKGNVGIGKKYYIQGAMVEVGKPTEEEAQEEKTLKLLDDFAKKHKMNGYGKKEVEV
jgi:HK97 family phage portal protein